MSELKKNYKHRYANILQPIVGQLEIILKSLLEGQSRVDRVEVRAKEVDSFLTKSASKNELDEPRYTEPLVQIQDQIGARIIVFFLSDVQLITNLVSDYFNLIECRDLAPENEAEFGYFGKHFIATLPIDALVSGHNKANQPAFFELQIKTLNQHAWSETTHDMVYKSSSKLTAQLKREISLSAAQSWGQDRLLNDIHEILTSLSD